MKNNHPPEQEQENPPPHHTADSVNEDATMPLVNHLMELRNRLITALTAILVLFLGLFYFANDLYLLVSKPIRDQLPEGSTMIATEVTSTFFAPFKLTLAISVLLAVPVILHQIWRFISPGLYAHEKRIAIPLLISSILLFYLGVAFAYFVIFPIIMAFFAAIGPSEVQLTPDINQYLSVALKLFFAFGIAFEIPVATLLMIWSGLTTVENLRNKRPYVLVGCFTIGMLMTPPDVISQTLLALPMWFLFECGIILGAIMKLQPRQHSAVDKPSE